MTGKDELISELSSNKLLTQRDLLQSLHSLLRPIDAHLSPGQARISIGSTASHFDEIAAQLEGFARRLWGAVPAGTLEDDGINWESYRTGLQNGTDPNHTEYWGDCRAKDQRMVEVSIIV